MRPRVPASLSRSFATDRLSPAMAAPGTCHRADSLAALLCGPTALAPQRAKDLNRRLLGHSLGSGGGAPSPKDASPRCPGRRPKADGALYGAALSWRAPEARRSAVSAWKAPAAPARRALCAQAGSSTFFRAAPLLRRPTAVWTNQRSHIPSPFSSPSQRLQSLQRALLRQRLFFLFFFFLASPAFPRSPRLPLSHAASGPCSTVPPANLTSTPSFLFPIIASSLLPHLDSSGLVLLISSSSPSLSRALSCQHRVAPAFLIFSFFSASHLQIASASAPNPSRAYRRTNTVVERSTRPSTRRDKTRQNNRRIVSRRRILRRFPFPSPLSLPTGRRRHTIPRHVRTAALSLRPAIETPSTLRAGQRGRSSSAENRSSSLVLLASVAITIAIAHHG